MTLEYHPPNTKKYAVDEILYHGTKTVELQTTPARRENNCAPRKNGSLYREVPAEYRDGKLFKEDILKEEYVPPVDEIVEVGVGGTIVGGTARHIIFPIISTFLPLHTLRKESLIPVKRRVPALLQPTQALYRWVQSSISGGIMPI